MIDIKAMHMVLDQLEQDRGIAKEKTIDAIEQALATAYKKEYGKRGQIIRAVLDLNTGTSEFNQIKIVVDETTVRFPEEVEATKTEGIPEKQEKPEPVVANTEEDEEKLPLFSEEQHILIEDAKRIKKDAELGDELVFPLEVKDDFGRIAAQTAKQVLVQKIREEEKAHISKEYGEREGEILTGTVQRIERGNIFVDLGRATGLLPYEEQIPGERYRQGERLRAYLYRVEETPKGVFLRLSRSHPSFLLKLFETESPEVAQGVVELKAIAREAGSRSKVAVYSHDEHIDPVGALVGQRGVRVSTVMSELGGEKIDIVEWSDNPLHFIEDSLSPAKVMDVEIISESEEEGYQARVMVAEDQQSLAIGRGGQNVRLAAKLTGWRIDIQSVGGSEEKDDDASEEGETSETKEKDETINTETETQNQSSESDTAEEPKEANSEKESDETGDETSEDETSAEPSEQDNSENGSDTDTSEEDENTTSDSDETENEKKGE